MRTASTSPSTPTTRLNCFLEFEKLGTYRFTWHAYANRSTRHGSENCNPDTNDVNQTFCASETYTFHVRPVTDLTVEDGGTSPYVATDEHALTIVAVNNGPNRSPGATATGIPTEVDISHGAYDPISGQWDISPLSTEEYYRSAGTSLPTLTLAAFPNDTADVSITHSQPYEVCVGSKDNPGDLPHTTRAACEAVTNASWNSTPVYDYNPDNNTATITAVQGTAGIGKSIPTLHTPRVHTPVADITWSEVEFIHGVPVRDYQVQWSANGVNGWTQLQTDLTFLVDWQENGTVNVKLIR